MSEIKYQRCDGSKKDFIEKQALKIIIRTARPKDIPALRELYLELEKDSVRYQPEHFVIGSRTDDFFQNIFDSPTQDILVADDNGQVTGFVHVMIIPQK